MKTKGLTLLEVMIVVAIIGLVAAIAIPAVTRLAENVRADICRTNLNTIDKSKMQWAFDNNKSDTDEPTADELDNYVVGEVPTECVVAGALYDIGNVITPALCSFHGNGCVNGGRMTLPQGIVSLVNSGELDASDIMNGFWEWLSDPGSGGDNSVLRTCDVSYSGYGVVPKDTFTLTSEPEIIVNGNILKGQEISHYSEEFIQQNKPYIIENSKSTYPEESCKYECLSKMDKGGYVVTRYDTTHVDCYYYDHQGKLLGNYRHIFVE